MASLGKSGSDCKPRKIGKRLQALIDRLQHGEKLCKSIRLKEDSVTEVTWHYEPSGKTASSWASSKAIELGLIKPAGDGLFGGETSQTWVAA